MTLADKSNKTLTATDVIDIAFTDDEMKTLAEVEAESRAEAIVLTPLEEADASVVEKGKKSRGPGKIAPLSSSTHNGALRLLIPQSVIDSVAHLRDFSIDSRFHKLAKFVTQLQGACAYPATQMINFVGIASIIDNFDTVEDIDTHVREKNTIAIEVIDNVPCIFGLPIWDRLPSEQNDFYILFKLYRDQKYTYMGDEVIELSRSMSALAAQLDISINLLYVLSKIYHWPRRCEAYDFYMAYEIKQQQDRKRKLLQNDHSYYAQELTRKSFEKLSSATLKPKELLDMLELGFKYSRISLGMPGDKPEEALNGSGGGNATINLFQQDNSYSTSQTLNIDNSGKSKVEKQFDENIKSSDTMLSILNVLQRSGAMTTAVNEQLPSQVILEAESIEE